MSRQPPFHLLPSIDSLLRLQEDVPGALAKQAATLLVVGLKQRISNDWPPSEGEAAFLGEDALRQRLERIRADLLLPFHRRAVNATGILLHTGLGRAPLPEAAIRAITEVAGQGLVEVEAESGRRGRRETAVAELCCALTGAEAALVVNNNAAATLFGLDVLARGREVPVSRGELVEIGGGFRMPEVMERAGCRLVEVGATNRSRLQDYERAINENTGCLLKVHPSNFRIEGFTEEVPLLELVALGKRHGLPVFEDLGSGYLLADPLPHDSREPSVPASVASGADLISFSGDKLLG
ncbi:MAG: L-seryl-tRNA(Sec) selenium transferase, partial [Planctomycetota bacterium]